MSSVSLSISGRFFVVAFSGFLMMACSHSRWEYPFEREPVFDEAGNIITCPTTPETAAWRKKGNGRKKSDGRKRHNVDHHVVAVNEDGDLRATYHEDCPVQFDDHFADIMTGLRDYAMTDVLAVTPSSDGEGRDENMPDNEDEVIPCYKNKGRKVKIMVFVHGGLVGHEDAIARAESRTPHILCHNDDEEDNYYPIFFVWNTKALDTYTEQIFWLRDGEKLPNRRYDQAALHVLSDIGSGFFRAPLQYLRAAERFVDLRVVPFLQGGRTNDYTADPDFDDENEFDLYQNYQYRYACNDDPKSCADQFNSGRNVIYPLNGVWGIDGANPNAREIKAGYVARYPLVTLPTGIVTPAVDGFGRTAWDNMRRRTLNTSRRPSEFSEDLRQEQEARRDERIAALRDRVPNFKDGDEWFYELADDEIDRFPYGTGGFAKFMAALEQCFRWRDGKSVSRVDVTVLEKQCTELFSPSHKDDYEIDVTFIGHSMGTIVLNQLLPSFRDIPKSNIVYMAAAATIADSYRTIVPTLREAEAGGENDTLFYNLMLHPKAEALDQYAGGLVPEGSLLEWIDEFLGDSQAISLKTFGKWRNVREVKPRFPKDVRGRMVFRVYSANNRPEDLPGTGVECLYFATKRNRRANIETDDSLDRGPDGRCYPISHGDFENFGFWRQTFWRGPTKIPPEVKREEAADVR